MTDEATFSEQELSLSEELLFDALCVQFERALRAGNPLDRARFVANAPEALRARLVQEIDLLLAESSMSAAQGGRTLASGDIPPYEDLEEIGRGAMGTVYRARDPRLDRWVAVKVLRAVDDASGGDILHEAQALASLDHVHIVPIYDVGRTNRGASYVVSKLVEGEDLASLLRTRRFDAKGAATLVMRVAQALHHAHRRGLVHRDVKPGNILVGDKDHPYLSDFGLALRDQDFGRGAALAGTPAYMSPEQARGESHRVDGRSDVFSLGAVFYEMIAGRRPFRSTTRDELLAEIATVDARPPRQLDDSIPRELERICLKALASRASDRYTTALDFANDLEHWLAESESPMVAGGIDQKAPLQIVPRGLRPFEQKDQDFFLQLLPGPRDRLGLPDVVGFWRDRITDPELARTVPVGLLYGASGSGKSSLVRAGVLPRLGSNVSVLSLEATSRGTEERLLQRLHHDLPELASQGALSDALARVRRGEGLDRGHKLLIVIDQFEQYLHGTEDTGTLAHALRHCDGVRCQALLVVRDDFWVAVSRFLREVEIHLAEGQNSHLVDLFTKDHARTILETHGRALGALQASGDLTRDQREFIHRAVDDVAQQGGKVVAVHLVLLSEALRQRPWVVESLVQIGGAAGVGLAFLEQAFGAGAASLEPRGLGDACRRVLARLLPSPGPAALRPVRTEEDLERAAASGEHPRKLSDVLDLLDQDLRIVSPKDPASSGRDSKGTEQPSWQLAHDHLVPALRRWLRGKERETWRGRLRLLLQERAATWDTTRDLRLLPRLSEWLFLLGGTRASLRSDVEHAMLRAAGLRHGKRLLVAGVFLACLVSGAFWIQHELRLAECERRGKDLVRLLYVAEIQRVPSVLAEMSGHRQWTDPFLRETLESASADPRHRVLAAYAMLPVDTRYLGVVTEALLTAEPMAHQVLRDALGPHRESVRAPLLDAVQQAADPPRRLRAFVAFCHLFATDSESTDVLGRALNTAAPFVARELLMTVAERPGNMAEFVALSRSSVPFLRAPLEAMFREHAVTGESKGAWAASVLADYLKGSVPGLAMLLLDAGPEQFPILARALEGHFESAKSLWFDALAEAPEGTSDEAFQRSARRRANAVLALLRAGRQRDLLPWLEQTKDPTARSYVLARWPVAHVSLEAHLRWLEQDLPVGVRRALILALAESDGRSGFLAGTELHQRMVAKVLDIFEREEDPGIHGAARAVLLALKRRAEVAHIESSWAGRPNARHAAWWVDGSGATMVAIRAAETCSLGSPDDEPGREPDEVRREVLLERPYAIAAHEVTVEQYRRFDPSFGDDRLRLKAPDPDCPVVNLTWDAAVRYCNWMSAREGLELCYEDDPELPGALRALEGALDHTGYRLPTEAEWERACRAGATTSRYFGRSDDLLPRYAWFHANAPREERRERTRPVGSLLPNDLGLFDMLGNAMEWCHDPYHGGSGPPSSSHARSTRVIRGGCFYNQPFLLRCADRVERAPDVPRDSTGFRVARTLVR